MNKFISEFKDFALKGNIIDMAIAFILGVAFKEIITALVNSIILPLLSIILGGTDFSTLDITIFDTNIEYGFFIQAIVKFVLIALSLFFVVKAINKSKKKEEEAPAAPAEPSKEEVLLGEIRDLLKK